MSTKHEWLVILPDYPDALSRRMDVRSTHLNNIKPDVSTGMLVMGGATMSEPAQEGKPLQLNGSILVMVAETKEEALERVHADVYYKTDVWDKSKVQIFPFKTVVREQM